VLTAIQDEITMQELLKAQRRAQEAEIRLQNMEQRMSGA
jgi:hypothetical protein